MSEKSIKGLVKNEYGLFDELFRRYYNPLFFFATRYVNDRDEAENLVQETFMAFWVNRDNIGRKSENALKAWLYNTLKNKCLNFLEKEMSRRKYDSYLRARNMLNVHVLKGFDINEALLDEVFALLDKALEEMPEQSRAVFEMSRLKGMKNREIADALDISVKAVEANMTRALKYLRRHFSDYLPLIILLIS